MFRRPSAKPAPSGKPEPEPVDDELRMGFLEHLSELRYRLFRAMAALVLGTLAGIPLTQPVLEYLLTPYGRELQVLGPTGGVVTYFKVALMLGGIIAIPVMTYQILMFILPGLTRKERRYLLSSLPAITGLFVVGVAFAWFILMPPAISFLEGFQADIFEPEWTAGQYISFVTALLFWMGVAFEVPLIFFVISLLGLVGPGVLIRNWRGAIVGASVAAAVITPTIDPVNMFLVMGPLLGLYVISIGLVVIGRRMAGHR
jgi:sec-independent protein translocase protein TatC